MRRENRIPVHERATNADSPQRRVVSWRSEWRWRRPLFFARRFIPNGRELHQPQRVLPVCGQQVFFYQSPYGGRVFFDDVGWPWPKHPCTDKKSSQAGPVQRPKATTGRDLSLRGKAGEQLDVYELETMNRRAPVGT